MTGSIDWISQNLELFEVSTDPIWRKQIQIRSGGNMVRSIKPTISDILKLKSQELQYILTELYSDTICVSESMYDQIPLIDHKFLKKIIKFKFKYIDVFLPQQYISYNHWCQLVDNIPLTQLIELIQTIFDCNVNKISRKYNDKNMWVEVFTERGVINITHHYIVSDCIFNIYIKNIKVFHEYYKSMSFDLNISNIQKLWFMYKFNKLMNYKLIKFKNLPEPNYDEIVKYLNNLKINDTINPIKSSEHVDMYLSNGILNFEYFQDQPEDELWYKLILESDTNHTNLYIFNLYDSVIYKKIKV